MADDVVKITVKPRETEDGSPGATAAFPYDRATVERFREAFTRARWREDLGAWFVPGKRAEQRLTAWSGREWSGVLAFADQRGRDAFEFEPIVSPYLDVDDGFVVRTPYSRTVVGELREVPWARWDPALRVWRVPFRSFEELRRRWTAIESSARLAEPEERQKRKESRAGSPVHSVRQSEAAELRRRRYPVPEDALPPLDRVVMTHVGCVMFTTTTGELVEPTIAARFYPKIVAGTAELIWSAWRRPTHAELVQAWPARTPPGPSDFARGWWQPTIEELRPERRKAASLERGRETRKAMAPGSDG
ncbi:MAG: hypothetical protein JWR10_4555 [Rubritepida sp.]|nr:hypothetical protein [Rubritepida sp.]